MAMPKSIWFGVSLAVLLTVTRASADDLRPQAERPLADEKCIERCDVESDRCMQAAEGDTAKLQACDDKYSQCLQACERAGSP